MSYEGNIISNISKALSALPKLIYFFGLIYIFIQSLSIPALAQRVEFYDGYNLVYYDNGSKDIINGALNYLRWDGAWRPADELNISNGSWPYLYSENASDAQFRVNDTTLAIPKANTKFKTRFNSISYELKYSKAELQGKEKYVNLTNALIDFPYSLRSEEPEEEYEDDYNIKYDRFHFKAGIEHIVIHDDTPRDYIEDGKVFQDVTYLNKNDYDFRIKNGQIRLVFKKDALNKLKGNVIIEIRTWDVIGVNNSLWGGNITFDSTDEVKATGNVELKQKVNDYVLYTRFDEGSGRTIHNERIYPSSNIPAGNLEGDLGNNSSSGKYLAGKYGQAIFFNGKNNKVLFNDDPTIRLPFDFTISYYLKLEPGVDNSDTDIVRKGSTATADPKQWYKTELTNNIGHGDIQKGTSTYHAYDSKDRRDGLWHFYTFARRSQTCSFAVDGVIINSSTCANDTANTAQFSIGSKDTYIQTTGLDFTNGTIDEVRVYDRWLNTTETASIQNNTHYLSGTITRNLTLIIRPGEEIKELGCDGVWDRTVTKVDVLASYNNISWDMIQSNAYPNVTYSVPPGNSYRYSRCSLSTTDASKTPVIQNMRARINPASSSLIAEAGGPYFGDADTSISFTGSVSGGTLPYTYSWDFGDGGTSTLQNPVHSYTMPGSYTANFTVIDINGNSSTDPASVTINPRNIFNISNILTASGKTYVKDTLSVGKLFYIDRTYKFTSIPSAYAGLDYIKTATTDRYYAGANFLQFDVNADVTVYVAYDDRISPKPSWLSSFTDTGDNLVRDSTVTFSIYARKFPAGHISLDGCAIPPAGDGGMYVVIVKPEGTSSPPPSPPMLGITISESPDPVLSSGTSQVTVHVAAGGDPVQDAAVSASVTGGSLNVLSGFTDVNGDFSTVYNAPIATAPTIYTLSANASKTGYLSNSTTDQITVDPVPQLNFIVMTPSATTTLTTGQAFGFNATAKDQNGNPMSGVNISWTSSNLTVGSMIPSFSITGLDGKASSTFNSFETGTTIITAQNGSISSSTAINSNPPLPLTMSVAISESPDPVLSSETSQVTVHASAGGAPVEGAAVSVSVSVTGGGLAASSGLTDLNGDFKTTYYAPAVTTSTAYTIAANASKTGYIFNSTNDQITVNPVPELSFIIITPSATTTLTAGQTKQFSASARDQNGNPMPGVNISWTSSNLTVGNMIPLFSMTGPDGTVSSVFNSLGSGTTAITAQNGSISNSTAISVNPVSSALITNIAAASGKTYVKDTLSVGKLFYIDRTYKFTSIPSAYAGLDYIKTATTDRYYAGANFLQFDVNADVTVYVAYDDRISPKPSWLSSFTDTGDNLVRDSTVVFSIYAKKFPAGHISLDGCAITPAGDGGMYVVIVKPEGTSPPQPPSSLTLSPAISESSDPVLAGGTSQVTVHVTAGGTPVEGASISLSATDGSLGALSGLTDLNGDFKTNYIAPNVTASTAYTISANASKTGFTAGSGTDQITVNPVSAALVSNIVTASGKTYVKDTLSVGKLFYIDRTYKFTSVPSAYAGLDYIKTATTDRYYAGANFLQFDVNADVTVYVAYDDRVSPKPSWLSSFADTGDNLVRDSSVTFSIYSRNYPAGHISLEGCAISPAGDGGMYVVIVK